VVEDLVGCAKKITAEKFNPHYAGRRFKGTVAEDFDANFFYNY